jgi:hypothetical protein
MNGRAAKIAAARARGKPRRDGETEHSGHSETGVKISLRSERSDCSSTLPSTCYMAPLDEISEAGRLSNLER